MGDLIKLEDFLNRVKEENKESLLAGGEDFTFEIDKNMLKIKVKGGLLYNTRYYVSIDGIKSTTGKVFKKEDLIQFDSKLLPYHSSITKVREILKDFSLFFKSSEVGIAIRDASQKAYQYQSMNPDPNLGRFELLTEKDDVYFAVKKYTAYYAAYILLSKLLTKVVSGSLPPIYEDGDEGEIEITSNSDLYEFKLGDFQVKPGKSSDEEDSINGKEQAEALDLLLERLKDYERILKTEWKFWLDESNNRNRRGYSSVTGSGIKTDHFTPEDRDF